MRIFLSNFRLSITLLCVAQILVVVPGALTAADASFESWLATNSIPAESSDPEDRNGPLNLTNIEAYAYGLNPFTALASDLPQLTGANTSTGLGVFYRRNTDAADLAAGLQGSADIADWAEVIPASESVLWTVDGVEGREAVIAWGGSSPQFVRFVAGLAGESPFVDIAPGTLPESQGFLAEITITEPYSISKYEVTGSAWQKVAEWGVNNGYAVLVPSPGDPYPVGSSCADDHPAYHVNWLHAVIWCNAKSEMEGMEPVYFDTTGGGNVVLRDIPPINPNGSGSEVINWDQSKNGYRLPTRIEWEYAARGGQSTNNYFYSGSNTLDDIATHADNSFGAECQENDPSSLTRGTWPVGSRAPNELGLYDMSGNVYEWHWDPSFSGDPVELTGRSASGGSWLFGESVVNFHGSYQPIQFGAWLGFRLARNQ